MPDEPYSKREQDHFFGDLFKRMDKQDASLNRIEEQTMRTNGRVTRLEIWKTAIIWLIGIIAGFLAFAIPYTISVIKKDVSETAQTAVSSAIMQLEQSYDIRVNQPK